jgi:hypothetical protein
MIEIRIKIEIRGLVLFFVNRKWKQATFLTSQICVLKALIFALNDSAEAFAKQYLVMCFMLPVMYILIYSILFFERLRHLMK